MSDEVDALDRWRSLFGLLFNGQSSNVALLDLSGTVLEVNTAWRQYGRENGQHANYDPVGKNYLRICERAVEAGCPSADEAYLGLCGVLRARRPKFTMVYPCHTTAQREWYRMWVEPQNPQVPAVIVAHQRLATKPWVGSDDAPPATTRAGWGGTENIMDALANILR